jgi:hypothetical protein
MTVPPKTLNWPKWDEIRKLEISSKIVSFDESLSKYIVTTSTGNVFCSANSILDGTCLPDEPLATPNPEPPSSTSMTATPGPQGNNVVLPEATVERVATPDMAETETSVTKKDVKAYPALPFEVEFNSDSAKTQWLSTLVSTNTISVESTPETTDYAVLDAAFREQLISNLFILSNYTGALGYSLTWDQFHDSFNSTSSLQLAEFGRDMSMVAQQKAQEDALAEQSAPPLEPSPFLDMLFGLDETDTTVSQDLIDNVVQLGFPLEKGTPTTDDELVAQAFTSTNELSQGYLTTAGLDIVRQEVEAAKQRGNQWQSEIDDPLLERLSASISQMRLKTRDGSPVFGIPTKSVIESFEAIYNAAKQQKDDYDLVANYEQASEQGDLGSFLLELAISTNDVGDVVLAIDDILKGEADAWTLLSLLPLVNYAATKAGRLASRALGYSDEFVPVAAKVDDMPWHFWQTEDGSIVYAPFKYEGATNVGPDDFRYGATVIQPPSNALNLPVIKRPNTCAIVCAAGIGERITGTRYIPANWQWFVQFTQYTSNGSKNFEGAIEEMIKISNSGWQLQSFTSAAGPGVAETMYTYRNTLTSAQRNTMMQMLDQQSPGLPIDPLPNVRGSISGALSQGNIVSVVMYVPPAASTPPGITIKHRVLVYGVTPDYVIIHDPDGDEVLQLSRERFENAYTRIGNIIVPPSQP